MLLMFFSLWVKAMRPGEPSHFGYREPYQRMPVALMSLPILLWLAVSAPAKALGQLSFASSCHFLCSAAFAGRRSHRA
jgi:hypothetical protein